MSHCFVTLDFLGVFAFHSMLQAKCKNHKSVFYNFFLSSFEFSALFRQIRQYKSILLLFSCVRGVRKLACFQLFPQAATKLAGENLAKSKRKSFPYSFLPTRHETTDVCSKQLLPRFSQSDGRIQGSPVKTSVKLKLQKEQHETRSGIFCETMCFLPNF